MEEPELATQPGREFNDQTLLGEDKHVFTSGPDKDADLSSSFAFSIKKIISGS